MYQIDFNHPIHIHFIGIGGISMSALAEILLQRGFTVSGSDMKQSTLTDHLKGLGCQIMIGQKASNIVPGIDLVVYTAAISQDNPEFMAVVNAGIPMLTRAELLGQIMRNYPTAIAVSGTHGKTTTTSMISHVLLAADADPTISVGGILPAIGGNLRVGHSGTFVAEACEYTNSFLSLFPTLSIILNMDADHLDFFKDIDDIRHSFRRFAELLPKEGTLIINADTPEYESITDGLSCHCITYGIENAAKADYTACNITYDELGHPTFDCYVRGSLKGTYSLQVPGIHNVSNSLSVIAACDVLGLGKEQVDRGFASFYGTERRFQHKGKLGTIEVFDDYAHHPTEIKATLRALMNYPHHTVWCVFQPHTYTRTYALLDQFAEALTLVDHVVLADIYAAREKNTIGISSADLQKKIQALGTPCEYLGSFDEIEQYLLSSMEEGDILLTMGAGNVVDIGEHLLGI